MEFPKDVKYTKEHEWVRVEGNIATVGVTDYAQDSLGDVVYLELPQDGANVTKDETFGVVESVKAVSDLYSPISGTVAEINDALVDNPEVINDDPYGDAWMLKVEMSSPAEIKELLTADEYKKYVEEEK
ncbi:MAG: glycine cleavage system protein H [Deltaproteobacteria bacterium RIFCSPLOWO2_12_FULL_43_16]|nr:MAG: glycine cleavage system protein H [Deltaproteobacteria bacterium GWA2_43_19]OGQ09276.1 MAG: glycine cleavage system protein H [Deltaproteobacteria bacterium RIFCSPHIGHO2_02_FULL_43_33]OGQ44469.1 MAG: glycine cleavage system protein H [Deltaproteobacteria bacterium RIFCSPLOWO2_01_FULL_42_9]OGQ57868.1 MAG: glycine cleavage system protein H [Deltaproteobacteria bacterium RIFCSPLOWO2_12_FULL_43_16]HBR18161.1 glycine cleavage system protein GcvH [Deltaproteobacteria bacterium]